MELADPNGWLVGRVAPTVRKPVGRQPKSLLPGNGIFRETEISGQRQRDLNGFEGLRTPLQRPNLAKTIPPIRGYSPKAGKSPLEQECVVGLRGLELGAKHAVAVEPVSRA